MNLEQIDTSTTAGKIEVMRLAEQGRNIVSRPTERRARLFGLSTDWEPAPYPNWNWSVRVYAVIAEPVEPNEVWAVVFPASHVGFWEDGESAHRVAMANGAELIRYVRAGR